MGLSFWSNVTWDLTRACGLTAYTLLTFSVMLGLALSLRWQSARWPRLITNDLHRFLTLLAMVFATLHGLAAWLDPYMRFGLAEVLVPLASHYRPLWMALGILAGYLLATIWISSELRPRIGYAAWRRLHGLTFAVYALATLHGIATGSDTHAGWTLALYAGSALGVGGLLIRRLLTPAGPQGRTKPNLAGLTALVLLLGAVWAAIGPAQQGWNAIANGEHATVVSATVLGGSARPDADAFAAPFSADLQGTLTKTAPDAAGDSSMRIDAVFSDGIRGSLHLRAEISGVGELVGSSNSLVVTGQDGTPRYTGTIQDVIDGGTGLYVSAIVQRTSARIFQLEGTLQVALDGQVSGNVQGTPL